MAVDPKEVPASPPKKRGRPKKQAGEDQKTNLPDRFKKPSEMIQISTNVSFIGRKMWNVLIINALETLGEEQHTIDSATLLKSIGWDGALSRHRTNPIESHIQELVSASVAWNVVDGKRNEFSATSLVAGARYNRNTGEITYEFARVLKDLIRNPVVYGMIDLGLQSKFSSRYSLPLYEQAARYYNPDQEIASPQIPIDVFTSLLGKPQDTEIKAFKRNLTLPIEEINESAPFWLKVEFQRGSTGRSFAFAQLTVKPKPIETAMLYDEKLLGRIKAIGVSDQKARFALADYPPEHLDKHLIAVEELVSSGAQIRNPAGYFLDAIKTDYVYGMVVRNRMAAETKAKKEAVLREMDDTARQKAEEREKQVAERERRRVAIFSAWQELPDEERSAMLAEFEQSIRTNRIVLEEYRAKGLTAAIVGTQFFSTYGERILSVKGECSSVEGGDEV